MRCSVTPLNLLSVVEVPVDVTSCCFIVSPLLHAFANLSTCDKFFRCWSRAPFLSPLSPIGPSSVFPMRSLCLAFFQEQHTHNAERHPANHAPTQHKTFHVLSITTSTNNRNPRYFIYLSSLSSLFISSINFSNAVNKISRCILQGSPLSSVSLPYFSHMFSQKKNLDQGRGKESNGMREGTRMNGEEAEA